MGPVYNRRHNSSSNLNPAFLACDAVISNLRGFALRPFCSPPMPTLGSDLSMRISHLTKSTPYMRTFSTNHDNREHHREHHREVPSRAYREHHREHHREVPSRAFVVTVSKPSRAFVLTVSKPSRAFVVTVSKICYA